MIEMNIGKAIAICSQINNDKFSEDEKAQAIYHMFKMPTQNGIDKGCLLQVIKYLWYKLYSYKVGRDVTGKALEVENE